MIESRIATPEGRLVLVSATEDEQRDGLGFARQACVTEDKIGGFVDFRGGRAYLKGSPLRGKARVRHALRNHVLRSAPPRLREFENLTWLREHRFRAAEPLVAAVLWRAGCPVYQLLLTREVREAKPLREHLAQARAAERARLVDGLAQEVARMHSHGFVHRDLYPRNLVVTPEPDLAVFILDAWRGGVGRDLRGPNHDLACFLVYAAALLDGEEQRAFLTAYRRTLYRAQDPTLPPRWIDELRARRERLVARTTSRADEPEPPRAWPPREVLGAF